jgi:hypothetical protein
MTIIPVRDVYFDDKATLAMGEAFDHACVALHRSGISVAVREMIAERIIWTAKDGERDPNRLCEKALIPFGIEDMSMLDVSVDRNLSVAAYASVTRAAWPSSAPAPYNTAVSA